MANADAASSKNQVSRFRLRRLMTREIEVIEQATLSLLRRMTAIVEVSQTPE